MIFPVMTRGRYGGVERLVGLLAREFSSRHQVVVIGAAGSAVSPGVELVEAQPPRFDFEEPGIIPALIPWALQLRDVENRYAEIFLDFSHSHQVGLRAPQLKQICWIWHDPAQMQPRQPEHNVAALSQWQADRFRQCQGQEARVLDPVCADTDFYQPGGEVRDRVLTIGKQHPTKGNLQVVRACKTLKQPVDVVGPMTAGDPPGYVAAVAAACDSPDAVFYGEVAEEGKLLLLQQAKALVYLPQYDEAHSHKLVEAMCCGTPAVALDRGAMREVIEEGVTGFLIESEYQLPEALKACETIDRGRVREAAVARWCIQAAGQRIEPTAHKVLAEHEEW